MNRIYQGRVTKVEIPDVTSDGNEWLILHRDRERAQFLTRRIPELHERAEPERLERSRLSKV